MPAWVFFDVDQTLCDFETSMRRAVSRTVEEIWRRHPGREADRLSDTDLHDARALTAAAASPSISMSQIRRQSLAVVLERVNPNATAADVDAIVAFYFDARFERPNLYPDTVPALEILASRYRLGIITNGNSYPRHLGLHRFFTEVLLSTDVGVAKPDPAIYRLASARVGHAAEELVMVGDSQVNDVDAATTAGWRAVRLDREMTTTGSATTGSATTDSATTGRATTGIPVIGSLAELPAILEAM